MADAVLHPLETILRLCAAAGAEPWYPSSYAKSSGVDRNSLDEPLNDLRLAGLIKLTDWTKDRGQGCLLTPDGKALLDDARALERLRTGKVPEQQPPPQAPAPADEARTDAIEQIEQSEGRAILTTLLVLANVVVFGIGLEWAGKLGVDARQYLYLEDIDEITRRRINGLYLDLGALSTPSLLRGQWWRLLTMMFVHIGIIHIAMNMLSLLSLGNRAERIWGRLPFLTVYVMAGFLGSCVAIAFGPVFVAGASCAICGLFGAEVVWLQRNRHHLAPEIVVSWSRSLLMNFILLVFISTMPGVSAAGHFGGLVGGIAAGLCLDLIRFGPKRRRAAGVLGLVGIVLVGLGMVEWALAKEAHALNDLSPRLVVVELPPAAQEEAAKFHKEYVPTVKTAVDDTWQVQLQVAPLVKMRPAQRDAEAVQKAKTALHHQRREIRKAEAAVNSSGPYRGDRARQARKASLDYLQALDQLCQLAETCLEGKDTWMEDEAAWERQAKVCHERQNLWETVGAK